MHDPSVQISAFLAASERAAAELSTLHGRTRTPEDVREALVTVLAAEDQLALLERNLSHRQMVEALLHFTFEKPQLLAQLNFADTIIPDDVPIALREALAKHRNEIWLVHKYDPDPFPSNPHAHNEVNGLKLHLGTGELFRKRDFVGKIRAKDLLAIRQKLDGIPLPPLAQDIKPLKESTERKRSGADGDH